MQVCTSLQTDNNANNPPLNIYSTKLKNRIEGAQRPTGRRMVAAVCCCLCLAPAVTHSPFLHRKQSFPVTEMHHVSQFWGPHGKPAISISDSVHNKSEVADQVRRRRLRRTANVVLNRTHYVVQLIIILCTYKKHFKNILAYA